MAIEFMDNFSVYGVDGQARMLNGPYAEVSGTGGFDCRLVADPDPNAAGAVLRMRPQPAGTAAVRRVLLGTSTTVGIAQRLWLPSLPSVSTHRPEIASFRDASNNVLCTVAVTTTGALTVWQGRALTGTQIGATPGPVIVANAWQHVEVRAVLDSTTGEVQIRVDGVEVLNLTGVNTSASDLPAAQVALTNGTTSAFGGGENYFSKDLVIWNGFGTRNTTFVGPVIVASVIPDSDVALNWTPTGDSVGWRILDNAPPVDTNHIAAGASPIPAAYEASLTNLPADATAVRAVMSIVRARKTDGGDGNLQAAALSGASAANGANRPITTAFTYWTDVYEEDPATSALWTPAGVNAMRLRLNRTV